jgi:ATP-dependent exoDNAse (exonuclease V) beta subunit
VLVASRTHAAPVIASLEAVGVVAIGVDLIPLREVSVVRDLVALTQALYHLGDRTAWLAVLRAPWCGVSLSTLTSLSRRGESELIWDAVKGAQRTAQCDPADRRRLDRIRLVLEEAIATRDTRPVAEWLESVWVKLGAPDAYPPEDLAHARAFLTALGERAAAGEWSDPRDLEPLLADLYAQPLASTANPVQVMTIHRAKGLEFDHVFVPSLDRELNRGREPLLRWLDLPREHGDSDLVMAPVPAIGSDDGDEGGDVGRYLKRLIGRRAANEQGRLLYVAVTRAKRTLWLSAAPRARQDGGVYPRSGTLLGCLWPALGGSFVAASIPSAGTQSVPAASPPAFRRLPADWSPPVLEERCDVARLPIAHQSLQPPEFSWVGETARHIGTVVHAALEALGESRELPPPQSFERERAGYESQLRRHGVPESELAWAAERVVEALTQTVRDERGRWIFDRSHAQARSELALTGIAAGRLTNAIIDRSFVDAGGTRWVIDFKTSRHEGGGREQFLQEELQRYRPQLETYIALARELGPEPVRAGLYFPLLGAFRELG